MNGEMGQRNFHPWVGGVQGFHQMDLENLVVINSQGFAQGVLGDLETSIYIATEGRSEMKTDGESQVRRLEGLEDLLPMGGLGRGDQDLLCNKFLEIPPLCRENSTAIHRGVLVIDAGRKGKSQLNLVSRKAGLA